MCYRAPSPSHSTAYSLVGICSTLQEEVQAPHVSERAVQTVKEDSLAISIVSWRGATGSHWDDIAVCRAQNPSPPPPPPSLPGAHTVLDSPPALTPFSASVCRTSICPCSAALMTGVTPSLFPTEDCAPSSSNLETCFSSFATTATWRAVPPDSGSTSKRR